MTNEVDVWTNDIEPSSDEIGKAEVNAEDHRHNVTEESTEDVRDNNEKEDESDSSLIGYCQFVVTHHKLAFGKYSLTSIYRQA